MLFETQVEREALINLMLLAKFSDKKLTISEEDTFTNILGKMYWEDVITPESYVNENLAKVREAIGSQDTIKHFIDHQCEKFVSDESKQTVLKKLNNLLHSDGLVESEKAFYERIEQKLK